MSFLGWLYTFTLVGLAVFGFNLLFMLALAAFAWPRRPHASAPSPGDWPTVLVQLPVFNERYVVERAIDAAARLDYPPERLSIQVLDDSTDDTAALARARAAYHRARGRPVHYLHRADRAGFKAGALAAGLRAASGRGEFVAIFDADFVPPPDFLRRLVPRFRSNPRLALAQARWEHLNPDQNALTRAQALACDGYFAVDQAARSRAGLLMNFNGSAGVWRRAAIEDAGNWQGDTLAEDLDLSYRAQLRGWQLEYAPEAAAPAELPAAIVALKRQQFRWAAGSFQVLRKVGAQLLTARMPRWRRLQGFLHLAGYLAQPLMLLALILSLPVVLARDPLPPQLGWLGWAGLGPLLYSLWGQITLRRDWLRRWLHYPALMMIGIGLSLTATHALWAACFGRGHEFKRTPKFSSTDRASDYALPLDWTTWGELLLALYALATGLLAAEQTPGLAPFIFFYALGFGFTAALGFWQSGAVRRVERASESAMD
jgi:cellulose synthase/poly-beta-1,6-N-acetylglucosamine synthase-like glycosyltransferase